MAGLSYVVTAADALVKKLQAQADEAVDLRTELETLVKHLAEAGAAAAPRLLEETATEEAPPDGFEDATTVAQVFSGVFFTGLAIWLMFTNGTKLSFVQRASLEKRMTVCCFINTYVAVFSAFFNFFQLTEVDDLYLPRATQFTLDFSRPIEWIVTCPMMQLVLVLMGGSRIPEYRRLMMPGLSAVLLAFGTSAMVLEGSIRFLVYGIGFMVALFMWYWNAKQVGEHSNQEESLIRGDSEFRKATVLLIATWFPFPIWFFLSPEGYGLVNDVLIIQVGWAFLNIVSKFTFIFYIQRIKDNYCNRLKVKRELYGMANPGQAGKSGAHHDDGPTRMNGMMPLTGAAKGQGELNAVVVETMTFLGMAQHTDRFQRLLNRADIRSPDMVENLTKERCEELQLPWDLVSALQRRIQVWQLEMRDNAELELERGEAHYIETDLAGHSEEVVKAHPPVPGSIAQELTAHLASAGGSGMLRGGCDNKELEMRMDKLESLMEKQCSMMETQSEMMTALMQRSDSNHQTQVRQVTESENNVRRRIEYAEQQIIGMQQAAPRAVEVPQPQQNGVDPSGLRRLEELVVESAERLAQRTEKQAENLGRTLQAKSEGYQAAQLRQQAEVEGNLARKLEEIFAKADSRHDRMADNIAQAVQSNVSSTIQTTLDSMFAQQNRRTVESEGNMTRRIEEICAQNRQGADVGRAVDGIRTALQTDMANLFSRTDQLMEAARETSNVVNRSSSQSDRMLDAIRNALQTDVGALLSRNDALMEVVRESRDVQKESNADVRRHCMMIAEQVSESQDRFHANSGQLAEIQRTMVEQNMKVIRCITDLGAGMSPMGGMQSMQAMQPMEPRSPRNQDMLPQGMTLPNSSGPGPQDNQWSSVPGTRPSTPLLSTASAANIMGAQQEHQWTPPTSTRPTTPLMSTASAANIIGTQQEAPGTPRARPSTGGRQRNAVPPSYGMQVMGGAPPATQ